uniref:Uncharacterized protein n=1 Tax=Tanacetum cinerariifolium TaxID=118510 RepID=A0A6L2NYX8_TANCI|nr:hypothetical protein [Tanacetum cinerariifolium]
MSKQKPEYVMGTVNGNIRGVCSACEPGGKEGQPLFAPVELCYVALSYFRLEIMALRIGIWISLVLFRTMEYVIISIVSGSSRANFGSCQSSANMIQTL